MPATPTAAHEAPPIQESLPATADHAYESRDSYSRSRRHQPARPAHPPTDDEILGLETASPHSPDSVQAAFDFDATSADSSVEAGVIPSEARDLSSHDAQSTPEPGKVDAAEPASFRGIFEANPELRRAWQDAQQYRETFATPEAARAATAQLADLDRMDALFFSRRPEDHAELARVVATLDPDAFTSLAQAMSGMFASSPVGAQQVGPSGRRPVEPGGSVVPGEHAWRDAPSPASPEGHRHSERSVPSSSLREAPGHAVEESLLDIPRTYRSATPARSNDSSPERHSGQPTVAQAEFFHAANAAAVEGVLDAIESQVERLLPEGVSKSARNRVVGEIYRELDTTLRSNRQLGQQMRDAFRSGSLDTDHQRAIVSLVTGRARQALPAVAKRVLNEWTSTVVAANNDRRARQRAAERRIDISGASGAASAGRSASPRSVDYARMSDSDILNL
jgi:hypothetical protein